MSLQHHWAGALLDPQRPVPTGLDVWNGSDIAHRFGVYRNNIMVSLTQALADTYPVCEALVGTEFFAVMARDFVRHEPPRSPVLHEYGIGFAQFIESFEAARCVPYLADMARLEWIRLQVLHAEDHRSMPREAIRGLFADPARVQTLRLRLAPAITSIASSYAVRSIWVAHHGHGDLAQIDIHRPETTWVYRRGLDSLLLAVDSGAHLLLELLRRGERIVDAATTTLAAFPDCRVIDNLALLIDLDVVTDALD